MSLPGIWMHGTLALAALPLVMIHGGPAAAAGPGAEELKRLTANIHWLGHDSFRIDGKGGVLYIDPYRLKEGPKADLILITHEHADHASPGDVEKIRKESSVIVAPAAAAAKLAGEITTVKPGDEFTVKGVGIRAVPAYNLNKFRSPGVPYHPREAGHVGFVVTVDGVRIYHAGDTDHIPEMAGLAPDVALLPVSGTYLMTAKAAVPVVVLPIEKWGFSRIPELFGPEVGAHSRSAVGVAELPFDFPVEIEGEVELYA
ncbi:MAG: MBL fold metallo-hydrolase [Desulfobacterales bacterium]